MLFIEAVIVVLRSLGDKYHARLEPEDKKNNYIPCYTALFLMGYAWECSGLAIVLVLDQLRVSDIGTDTKNQHTRGLGGSETSTTSLGYGIINLEARLELI